MKKLILFSLATCFSFLGFSQTISLTEQNETFSVGNKNAIVVNIPFADLDFVKKELKSEMKDWGGKYSSSKTEYSVIQGEVKELGEKLFDGFAKISESKEGDIKVSFAFDLGGAFLTSSLHKEQYAAISAKLKKFAVKCATRAVEEEVKTEEKLLKGLEKEQESLVKEKADLEKSIEDYKQKIAEAEKNIEKNGTDQEKKKEEVKVQQEKVVAVGNKAKAIK